MHEWTNPELGVWECHDFRIIIDQHGTFRVFEMGEKRAEFDTLAKAKTYHAKLRERQRGVAS